MHLYCKVFHRLLYFLFVKTQTVRASQYCCPGFAVSVTGAKRPLKRQNVKTSTDPYFAPLQRCKASSIIPRLLNFKFCTSQYVGSIQAVQDNTSLDSTGSATGTHTNKTTVFQFQFRNGCFSPITTHTLGRLSQYLVIQTLFYQSSMRHFSCTYNQLQLHNNFCTETNTIFAISPLH